MSKDLEFKMRIEAIVKGLDEVRAMAKEAQGLGKVAREIDRSQSAAYRLGEGARRALSAMTVGVAGAMAAFAAMSRVVINTDEQLNALSARTGIAADKLAELKYAAEQSNTSIETVARGMANFNRVLFDAQKGGSSAKLFQAIGLDPKALGDADTAISRVADRVRSLGTDSEKSALAQALFGSEDGRQMLELLSLGAEGIERLRKEARETGVTTAESAKAADAFKDAAGALNTEMQNLVRQGLTPLLPVLTDTIRTLRDGKAELGGWLKSIGAWATSTNAELDNLPKAIDAITDKIAKLKKQQSDLTKPGVANAINNFLFSDAEKTGEQIAAMEARREYLRGLLKRERERAEAEARAPIVSKAHVDFTVFDKPDKGGALRDLSSQRYNLAKAEAEAELKVLQDTLQRYGREWDYALDKNLVSFRAAAQARINIAQAEIDAQIKAREDELAAADKIASDPNANESKRLEALARVKALTADITVLRQRRGDVEVEEGRRAADQEEQLAGKLRKVRAELAALVGGGGAGAAVRAELEESFKELLESPSLNDADRTVLRQLIGAKGAEADLRDFQAAYNRALDEMSVAQDRINIQQRAGTLTETQAREQLVELYRRTGVEIEALIPKLEELAASSDLSGLQISLEKAKNKVLEMRSATDDLALQVRGNLGDAVGNFLTDFQTGAQSLGDALQSAMKNFERSILDIINKRLGQELVDSLLGPMKGSGGGGLLSLLGGLFGAGQKYSPSGVEIGHAGAIIGQSGMRRMVSPIAFAGAPRYHFGGVLRREVPFIGLEGEEVLTENDPRHRNNLGRGGVALNVNLIEAPGRGGEVQSSQQGNQINLDIIVEMIENKIANNIGRGSSSVFEALRAVSGLSRVPGAVR